MNGMLGHAWGCLLVQSGFETRNLSWWSSLSIQRFTFVSSFAKVSTMPSMSRRVGGCHWMKLAMAQHEDRTAGVTHKRYAMAQQPTADQASSLGWHNNALKSNWLGLKETTTCRRPHKMGNGKATLIFCGSRNFRAYLLFTFFYTAYFCTFYPWGSGFCQLQRHLAT